MALIFDIENWNILHWFNTQGTRAKKYVQNPDTGDFFFFKQSDFKPATGNKPEKYFKYEFWSEVIASEVGKLLGFDVLTYDIGIDGKIMGCISKSMIDSDKEDLIPGVKYLQAHDMDYQPENKDHRTYYTFQLIEAALHDIRLGRFIPNIIEVVIFDALIGNGDRHQENWAIINEITPTTPFVDALKSLQGSVASRLAISLTLFTNKVKGFAPIYDNGSSLARELSDEKVQEFVSSDQKLINYVDKGLSEIHWFEKKISHFQLINNLYNSGYKEDIIRIVNRVVDKFDENDIMDVINKIDLWVPEFVQDYKIPNPRKQLIHKIIVLRYKRLIQLLNA